MLMLTPSRLIRLTCILPFPATQTLCAETAESRERWLRAINSAGRPMALSDSYNVDFTSPLGSGLCAVVLKATKKHSGEACAVKVGDRSAVQADCSLTSCCCNPKATAWCGGRMAAAAATIAASGLSTSGCLTSPAITRTLLLT